MYIYVLGRVMNISDLMSPLSSSRDVSMSASFPKSVLLYWSSVTEQRGVECTVDHADFSIRFVHLYVSDSESCNFYSTFGG